LAHDERGRSRLHARATGIALAAGVLAELILSGHVTIRDSRVSARPLNRVGEAFPDSRAGLIGPDRYPPPADSVGHAVYEQIAHEPQAHQVRTWLGGLAPTITEAVAGRLTRLGLVTTEQTGMLRRTNRYVPIDINAGAAISVRLARRFTRQDPQLDWDDAVLGGLSRATGLINQVLHDDPTGEGRRHLTQVMHQIRVQEPPLIDLLANTEAAIGDAVLAHRT